MDTGNQNTTVVSLNSYVSRLYDIASIHLATLGLLKGSDISKYDLSLVLYKVFVRKFGVIFSSFNQQKSNNFY